MILKGLLLIVWLWLCLAVSPEGVLWAVGLNWFLLALVGEDKIKADNPRYDALVTWIFGSIILLLLIVTHFVHLKWIVFLGYTMTIATLSVRNIFGWKSRCLLYGVFEFFSGDEVKPIKKVDFGWMPNIDFFGIVIIILLLAVFNG